MHPRLYIWQKVEKKVAQKKAEAVEAQRSPIFVPRLSESKLKELTWSLDIHEAPNPVTHDK
ncbi:MAG: hypothetical protein Q7S15_02260 [bacterium]|nr:hypothetical protein [bacterium]